MTPQKVTEIAQRALQEQLDAKKRAQDEAEAAKLEQKKNADRKRRETWGLLEKLVDEDKGKRRTMLMRERSKYTHGANNDIDLDVLVRALCLISICIYRDPIPFEAMTTAYGRVVSEAAKLKDSSKLEYWELCAGRKRFGYKNLQRSKHNLREAAQQLAESLLKFESILKTTKSKRLFCVLIIN